MASMPSVDSLLQDLQELVHEDLKVWVQWHRLDHLLMDWQLKTLTTSCADRVLQVVGSALPDPFKLCKAVSVLTCSGSACPVGWLNLPAMSP